MAGDAPGGVVRLGETDVPRVVRVLSEAFYDYPVMRYVLGDTEDYAARLESLVHFFVMARVLRDEVLLGVRADDRLVACALVSDPGRESSPALADVRAATWDRLGEEGRGRYETFGAATRRFELEEPHLHLNMIGVQPSAQGRGLAGRLLRSVHELSSAHPSSSGVSLTTEVASNVALYERFGYEVLGAAEVGSAFTTRVMFRRDPARTDARGPSIPGAGEDRPPRARG